MSIKLFNYEALSMAVKYSVHRATSIKFSKLLLRLNSSNYFSNHEAYTTTEFITLLRLSSPKQLLRINSSSYNFD